jgi:hypothetical protein
LPCPIGAFYRSKAQQEQRPYKSDVLQWQEEALIELVDDGGDLGGLRVVDHHIYMCQVLL